MAIRVFRERPNFIPQPDSLTVRAAISAAQQQQTEKLGTTVEGVLSGIARLARADIRKLFDERGNLHSIRDLEDDERVHKIRLWDKNAALTNLARYVLDRRARLHPVQATAARIGRRYAEGIVAIVAAVLFGGHSYSPNSAS